MPIGPVTQNWKSLTPDYPDAPTLPATFSTPEGAWTYGALTDLIETDAPVNVVIHAQALNGKVGLCLVTEDCSKLASPQKFITPEMGKTTVVIPFKPEKSPARILVRNYGDEGVKCQARIDGAEIKPAG